MLLICVYEPALDTDEHTDMSCGRRLQRSQRSLLLLRACRRLQHAYEVSMPHSSLSWLLRRAIPQLDRWVVSMSRRELGTASRAAHTTSCCLVP